MATSLDGNLVLLMLSLMIAVTNLPMSNANIAHFDEYWKNKAKLARSAIMEAYHPDPYNVTNHLNHHAHLAVKENLKSNTTRRSLAKKYSGPCLASNPIDKCWRCSKDWEGNRMRLADCVLGFGRETTGGKGGKIYEVTDHSDDDVLEPKPGTLRHAVIQKEPLWIIFKKPMKIRLKQELMVSSNKTIDARGSNVHITGGCGITVQYVQNVIIHGLHIHDIKPGSGGMIRDSVDHYGQRTRSDGDGVSIFGACHVWVDHVSLSKCTDGLIDAIEGSTAVTISNCHMSNHNDVFLFGAMDTFKNDKMMQITVAFNHFGKGLVQRMPRCRWGFFHVVNNDYTHWLMYAIGGSKQPTILSQGNRFIAPPDIKSKEVTKREEEESVWKNWNWRSEEDLFLNGAFFRQSGSKVTTTQYEKFLIKPQSGKHVRDLARMSGPRSCKPGKEC